MIEVGFSSSFKRAFKRKIKGDRELEQRFWTRLEFFGDDPFDPRLRTHELSGVLRDLWSFTVAYDARVVFSFVEPGKALFIDIGSHDEVY